MPSSVAHVISFSALLILVLVSAYFVNDIQVLNTQRVAKFLAREISHRVARNLVELTNIALKTNAENILLIKTLDIPTNILNEGYKIKLSAEEGIYRVLVEIPDWSWLGTFSSEIPINETSTKIILETGGGSLQSGGHTITYSYEILSGVSNPVVWAFKENNTIRIGIGMMKS
mgnify:CR=1 FL=1